MQLCVTRAKRHQIWQEKNYGLWNTNVPKLLGQHQTSGILGREKTILLTLSPLISNLNFVSMVTKIADVIWLRWFRSTESSLPADSINCSPCDRWMNSRSVIVTANLHLSWVVFRSFESCFYTVFETIKITCKVWSVQSSQLILTLRLPIPVNNQDKLGYRGGNSTISLNQSHTHTQPHVYTLVGVHGPDNVCNYKHFNKTAPGPSKQCE